MSARRLAYLAASRRPEKLPAAITGPSDVNSIVRERVPESERREVFTIVYLNSRLAPVAVEVASIGTLNASLVHPREVFAPALTHRAASVILTHNHPSGDPTPSQEDYAITRRLQEVGNLLGIPVTDHIVLGSGGSYVSLRAEGALKP